MPYSRQAVVLRVVDTEGILVPSVEFTFVLYVPQSRCESRRTRIWRRNRCPRLPTSNSAIDGQRRFCQSFVRCRCGTRRYTTGTLPTDGGPFLIQRMLALPLPIPPMRSARFDFATPLCPRLKVYRSLVFALDLLPASAGSQVDRLC